MRMHVNANIDRVPHGKAGYRIGASNRFCEIVVPGMPAGNTAASVRGVCR